ncbi:MAG TPA: DUF481 domain-containing protein [Kiritimatiellia bacterium]|nr:DUF481 domain-containing protein [Kiritimatiellia bacterium]HRZ11136.1 DUF481 domain-containing protein [Kiritimatiellia bacterium]HSA19492.1 DUF481 domain-containing protein [Kiritimatiellia bacterium]
MKTGIGLVLLLAGVAALGWPAFAAGTADRTTAPVEDPTNLVSTSTSVPPVEAESPAGSEQPADTNVAPPVVVEPVEEEAPVKEKPARRGADLSDAFESSRGSKFGLSAQQRSLKVPGKEGRPPREKTAWRWTLELGVDSTSGNKDTLRYDGSLGAQKETDLHFFWFRAGGRYGKSEGERDTDNASAEARAERRLAERLYAALDGQVFQDRIAELSYRARANVSLGCFLVRSERTLLGLEAGPGYVQEKKGGEIDGYAAGRAAEYAERVLLSNLLAWQAVEYVVSVEDANVFFMNAEVGLEALLSATLSLRVSLEDRYDGAPADDKEKNDLVTKTALKWAF